MARRAVAVALLLSLLQSLAAAQAQTSPQFTSQPSNVTAAPSSTTTLPCTATGSPTPTIVWYKDGLLLTLDSRRQRDATGSLRITNLQNSDVGHYHCVASNTAGSVASLTVTLQLAYLNSPSSSGLLQVSVVNLGSLILSCEVPDSVPRPQVTWSPQPASDGRVTYSQNGTLIFSFWDSDTDNGVYQCTVTNPVLGTSRTSSRYFPQTQGSSQLYTATEFVIRPATSLKVVAGETAVFECFTTGRPVAAITWTKDSRTLTTSGRISTSQSGRVLTISGVTTSDAGSYSCDTSQDASQSQGGTYSISATGQLNVIVPPRITSGLQRTDVNLDQPASLTCRAEGMLPIQWTWKKDGVVVQQSQGGVAYTTSGAESTLTISSVRESDGGVYQCVARQPATGRQAASNDFLNPIAIAPVLTHGDALRDQLVLRGTTVVLPCTASGAPIPTYTWTRAGQSQPININIESRYTLGPGNGNLTISSASVSDSATLTCEAVNSAGRVSDTAQLRVINPPTVVMAPSGQSVITPGESLTLRCEVTPPDPDINVAYRWTRDGTLHTSNARDLMLNTNSDLSQNSGINGLYACLVLLSATGLSQADRVEWEVGSAVVTVGDPPVAPSPPTNHQASSITATTFLASWTAPSSNGGLALRNYTVETRRLGSDICPGDANYISALAGISSMATSATVRSLHPYSMYIFRVIAFNSVFRSEPSVTSAQFMTDEAVPQAPPTSLQVTNGRNEGELRVDWSPIASCVDYGGPITGYVVQYKTLSEATFTQQEVGVSVIPLTLTLVGLQLSTVYQVKVAAKTSVGVGPFTVVKETTTADSTSPPEAPAQLTGTVINSTTIQLTWVAPNNPGPNEITGYTLSYQTTVGQVVLIDGDLGAERRSVHVNVSDLQPGMTYTFRLAAVNRFGPGTPVNFTITLPGNGDRLEFYEEVWFYAVAAVGGLLLVAIAIATVFVCVCCCCKCAKADGKYYITSRRTTSSMSSSGFSEYHNKNRSQNQMIQIHSSPTPSRRSTDYADIGPGRFPQTGSSYPNPEAIMNGHVGHHHHHTGNVQAMYPHDQHMSHDGHMGMHGQFSPNEWDYPHGNVPNMPHQFTHSGQDYPDGGITHPHHIHGRFEQNYPPAPQDSQAHIRGQFSPNEQEYPLQNTHNMGGMSYQLQAQDSSSMEQMSSRFIDTLTRVHTPPNPHGEYLHDRGNLDYPPSSRDSQSTEESWNPTENLNFRGHMTNNPVSRSSSFKSTVSTTSFERGPLPPNISNDPRTRGHSTPLSPLPENQFFEQALNGTSMQDLQHDIHVQPSEHVGNWSWSVGQRMNRIGNQDLRNRAQSLEGMIEMEPKQQRLTRMELGESNLDIQQRALPPLPTVGMESGHATNMDPVPNPHSIEYSLDPEVQLTHSQSIPHMQPRKVMQYPAEQNTQQLPRSYQPENKIRSHGYPSQPSHTTNHPTHVHRQQPTSSIATSTHQKIQQHSVHHQRQQQMGLPPPPPFIKEQPTHPPSAGVRSGGQRFGGHSKQRLQHPLAQQHPGVVQSMTHLQHHQAPGGRYKPDMSHRDHHHRQQSLPDDQGIPPQQQNFNLVNSKVIPQHVSHVNQSTPNLAFNAVSQQVGSTDNTPAGFRRIPMTGGHTLSQYDDQTSQDTVAAWEQVDQIQQQFELDMQNMLTPRVIDVLDDERGNQFQFQHDTLNLDDSINSTSSFLGHTHSMVSPVAANNMKPPNGFVSSTQAPPPVQAKPPKVAPKMNPVMNGFKPSSQAMNKKRPSIPDLQHLSNNDPKKPQLRKGKVPRAVWVQTSTNKAIESSSESESDSDVSMDTVIAVPGDTESLKSSHV